MLPKYNGDVTKVQWWSSQSIMVMLPKYNGNFTKET